MLELEQENRLDSLSREFRAALRNRLPDLKCVEDFTDRLIVTIPAQHPETGAITVWLDGDEVTVGIGEYFHTHFEAYFPEDLTLLEREQRAAACAAEFIAAFITGVIMLRVSRDGRVAGTRPTVGAEPPGPEETDFLWSGPTRSSN